MEEKGEKKTMPLTRGSHMEDKIWVTNFG
jgi:hypothetical protein